MTSWNVDGFAGEGFGDSKKDEAISWNFSTPAAASSSSASDFFPTSTATTTTNDSTTGGGGFVFDSSSSSTGGFSFGGGGGDSGAAPSFGGGFGGGEFSFSGGGGFGATTTDGASGFGGFGSEGGGGEGFGFAPKKDADGDDDDNGDDGNAAAVEEEVGFTPMSGVPTVKVEEVVVETGEENEIQAFPATKAKLFQFEEGKWAERGIGKVSVNVLKSDPKVARVLFRQEQVGNIRMNAAVFAAMKPEVSNEKSVRLTAASADGKLTMYVVKFAKPSEATTLVDEINQVISRLGGGGAPKSAPAAAAAVTSSKPTTTTTTASAPKPAAVVVSPKKESVVKQKREGSDVSEVVTASAPSQETQKKKTKSSSDDYSVEVVAATFDAGSVAGVVTITSTGSGLVAEATFEGLSAGQSYSVAIDGTLLATKVVGASPRTYWSSPVSGSASVSSWVGLRFTLTTSGGVIVGSGSFEK